MTTASTPPVRNSTHILIVDDNREAGKSLAQMLTDSGCDEIRTVRSAARALAVAATFQPAIAFLGIPTPDGLEGNLAALLQKNSREKSIRLIGLTDRPEPPGRGRSAGFGRRAIHQQAGDAGGARKGLRKSPGNLSGPARLVAAARFTLRGRARAALPARRRLASGRRIHRPDRAAGQPAPAAPAREGCSTRSPGPRSANSSRSDSR